jgi:hypothetical protein
MDTKDQAAASLVRCTSCPTRPTLALFLSYWVHARAMTLVCTILWFIANKEKLLKVSQMYRSGAKHWTTPIIAPADISVLNNVFAWFINILSQYCAFNCSWTFLVHSPYVLDPPEPQ